MKKRIIIDKMKYNRIRNVDSIRIIDDSTIEIKVKNQNERLILKATPDKWEEEAKIFLEI